MLSRAITALSVSGLVVPFVYAQEVRYVDGSGPANGDGQSWATAYRSLHAALDDARGDAAVTQIWVAAGMYTPDRGGGNRNDTFQLVNNVAVLGGFAGTEVDAAQRDPAVNVCVLSGDLNGNDLPNFQRRTDNSRHIVSAMSLSGGMFDGFTLRGGNADFSGDDLLGGGALFIVESTFDVRRCSFADNIAGGNETDIGGFGGALHIRGGNVVVAHCQFQANRGVNGAALGILGSDPGDGSTLDYHAVIEDCDFVSNVAPGASGAIWTASNAPIFEPINSSLRVSRCNFISNRAEYFGALNDQNTRHLRVEDCVFRNNTTNDIGSGLVVSQTGGPDYPEAAVVTRCLFEGNSNPFRGSAVFIQVRRVLMDSCVARRNAGPTTIHSGPFIGFSFPGRDLELRNCLVHDNSGTGVFGFRNFSLTVLNSTIARNTNTGQSSGFLAGGIETSAAVVRIANTVLWNNSNMNVQNEIAQFRAFGSVPSVNFSLIQGLTGALGGTGNIAADPLFTGVDDFRLSAGSPAIDAGSNSALPEDLTLDLDGMGRFVNDPAVMDTGEGTGAIVDMGAYERVGGTPSCPADFNRDASVNSQDFFDFLAAFFALDPSADFNASGDVNSQDFFDFLAAFFVGC